MITVAVSFWYVVIGSPSCHDCYIPNPPHTYIYHEITNIAKLNGHIFIKLAVAQIMHNDNINKFERLSDIGCVVVLQISLV